MANFKHPETIGLHGGEYRSDPTTTSVAVPIYQTTSYQFKNAETAFKFVWIEGIWKHLY